MTSRRQVRSERAPAAIGPYSQGVWAGDLFWSAGQVPLDPATGELVPGGIESQARRVMENLTAVLDAAGLGWGDVVKTTIFLAALEDFGAVNAVYGEYLEAPYPARSTVEVSCLPLEAAVEIEVVARRP